MLNVARQVTIALLVLASACSESERPQAAAPDAALDAAASGDSDTAVGEDAAASNGGDASGLDASGTDASRPVCRDALPLRCGDRLGDSTSTQGRENLWQGYGCTARAESGPEAIYAFETDARCQVGVQLGELEADIDLFVLDECTDVGCTEASSTPLDLQTIESVTFQAQAGRDYIVVVDGYSQSAGSYALSVNCLCGDGDFELSDGEWLLQVDRRWTGNALGVPSPSESLPEEDYEAVSNGGSYDVALSQDWHTVSVGDAPWLGELTASPDGTLSYELAGGSTGAGGRLIIWVGPSGLQAELTLYGSGVPIVSSERGALISRR
jgi:hypothetical protein